MSGKSTSYDRQSLSSGTEQPSEGRLLNLSAPITGAVIGFLGAAVLYQKHFPSWVPEIFTDAPVLFFSVFVIVCAALGVVWSIVD